MLIRVSWSTGELQARLYDTPTAARLIAALPCESQANTWGEEVYFEVAVNAELEPDARQVVDPGTVCFWVDGRALALPYGPTPISQGSECRLVSAVNILGKFEGDAHTLSTIRAGESIRVELVGDHG
jgi:hypothetical protein